MPAAHSVSDPFPLLPALSRAGNAAEWGFFLIVKIKLTAPYYNDEEGLTALARRAGEDPCMQGAQGPTPASLGGLQRGAKRWLLVLKVLRLPAGVFSWRINLVVHRWISPIQPPYGFRYRDILFPIVPRELLGNQLPCCMRKSSNFRI